MVDIIAPYYRLNINDTITVLHHILCIFAPYYRLNFEDTITVLHHILCIFA